MSPKYFRTSLIILALGVLTVITAMILGNAGLYSIGDKLLSLSNLLAAYYLYWYGTLRFSPWRIALTFLLAVYIIGALFKAQHWPPANTLLTIALIGLTTSYTIWYLTKPNKQPVDHLKLFSIAFYFLCSWLIIMHWLPRYYDSIPIQFIVRCTTLVLFQFTYIYFHEEQKRQLATATSSWDLDTKIPPPPTIV